MAATLAFLPKLLTSSFFAPSVGTKGKPNFTTVNESRSPHHAILALQAKRTRSRLTNRNARPAHCSGGIGESSEAPGGVPAVQGPGCRQRRSDVQSTGWNEDRPGFLEQ